MSDANALLQHILAAVEQVQASQATLQRSHQQLQAQCTSRRTDVALTPACLHPTHATSVATDTGSPVLGPLLVPRANGRRVSPGGGLKAPILPPATHLPPGLGNIPPLRSRPDLQPLSALNPFDKLPPDSMSPPSLQRVPLTPESLRRDPSETSPCVLFSGTLSASISTYRFIHLPVRHRDNPLMLTSRCSPWLARAFSSPSPAARGPCDSDAQDPGQSPPSPRPSDA